MEIEFEPRAAVCPLCDAGPIEALVRAGEFRFERCLGCGFIFCNPMPSAASLSAFYASGEPGTAITKRASRMRRSIATVMRFWPLIFRKSAADIGCGGGFMAETMRRMGARATGVDVDVAAIQYAQAAFPKCRFVRCDIHAPELLQGEKFDFVYSSEVLEHVPGPRQTIAAYARLTRPGGWLYVTTPDSSHPKRPANIADWDVFGPPVHIQFFTAANLRRALEAQGFKVKWRFADPTPGLQLLARYAP